MQVKYSKVLGTNNLADPMTKEFLGSSIEKYTGMMRAEFVECRAEIVAKMPKDIEVSTKELEQINGCVPGAHQRWVGPGPWHPSLFSAGPGVLAGNRDPDTRGHPGERRGLVLTRTWQELLGQCPLRQGSEERNVERCESNCANVNKGSALSEFRGSGVTRAYARDRRPAVVAEDEEVSKIPRLAHNRGANDDSVRDEGTQVRTQSMRK